MGYDPGWRSRLHGLAPVRHFLEGLFTPCSLGVMSWDRTFLAFRFTLFTLLSLGDLR